MQSYRATRAFVQNLDPEAEHVAELPLECCEIGIDLALGEDESALRRAVLGRFRPGLSLANREAFFNNVLGQIFRVWRCRNRTRVAHTDIASQERLAHELR